MISAPLSPDESVRILALRHAALLDTPPEQAFDDAVRLASQICETPIALVSLVDEKRQWFKARVGLAATETPRDVAFCAHAILGRGPFVVPDSSADPRFADNPLVTGPPRVQFYAGVPLVVDDDRALGTLCVIDHVPRRLRPDQVEALAAIGRQVSSQIRLRSLARDLGRQVDSGWDFVENASDLIQSVAPDGRFLYANRAWHETLGYAREDLERLSAFDVIAPEHRAECARVFEDLRRGGSATVLTTFVAADGRRVQVEGRVNSKLADGVFVATRGVFRDVTARRRAEQELEEFSRFQRATLDGTTYSIIATDSEGTIRVFNRGAERMLGYRADELVGRATPAVIHVPEEVVARARLLSAELAREVVPGFEAFVAKARNKDEPDENDWTYVRKDGTRFPVHHSVTALRDGRGAVTGYLGIARDLTPEREARRAQRERDGFFERSLELLCIAGTDGFFKRVNPAFVTTLGHSELELLEQPFLNYVHPDDRAATVAEVQHLAAGARTVRFENRYRSRDGSYRTLVWTADPDSDAGLIFAAARDVTAERARESALRESEARHRAVLHASPYAIITIDERGIVDSFNPAAQAAFGYSVSEVVGRNVSMLMPEPHARDHDAYVARYLRTGEARVVGKLREVTALKKDGATFPAELAVSEVRLGDRRLFTGIVRDITERLAVDRAKNEFVSTVSHELRTPLTSIRGALGLLEGGIAGELPKEALELIAIARGNSERLIRLINDLLDVEKIQAGKLELKLRDIVPGELVTASLDGIRGMAGGTRIALAADVGTVPRVRGDWDRLVQVLTNLVSNAIKFSPPGAPVEVRLSQPTLDRVRFSVADRGPGIPYAQQAKLFGKFQQLDSGDARKQGGTGLGLAISKAIVEQHGGAIGLESREGQGSTFWFEVPLGATRPPSGPRERQSSILVVEDDDDVARILELFLAREGLNAARAASLAEARQHLAKSPPRAILLDLKLPDGSGLDFMDELQARHSTARIPVIVLTGSEPRRDEFARPVLVDWLVKPVDEGQLVAALRTSLLAHRPSRVLLVEDDPSMRAVLAAQIGTLGAECIECEDGIQALALARTANPDLLVLDVGIPRLDGFEVVDLLRRSGARTPPIVVYSGRDLSAAEREALTLGVTRHLTKALSSKEEFLATVGDLLRGVLETANGPRGSSSPPEGGRRAADEGRPLTSTDPGPRATAPD